MDKTKELRDGVVRKIVFEDESSIAETVVYEYSCRKVICFSVSSGCQVGCRFCGTGNKFIRNLTTKEIQNQINHGLLGQTYPKTQLMSMSMGDPMLNWVNLSPIIKNNLKRGYYFFISTVGIKCESIINDIIKLGKSHKKFGLQFSLHKTNDKDRLKLFRNTGLPYLTIDEMREIGIRFKKESGNPCYFNYIATGKETPKDIELLKSILKEGSHVTCSVMCNINKASKSDPKPSDDLYKTLSPYGSVSMFDPNGQDTIGAGCGQLLYVQDKMKKIGRK
jgi:23S rRNA (adenine2503-C2)-methyltransferase